MNSMLRDWLADTDNGKMTRANWPGASVREHDPASHNGSPLPTVRDAVIDLNAQRLYRAGIEIRLTPKATAVLTVLLSRRGQVVTRAELLDLVWPNMVVGDEVVTRAINELRTALADDASQDRVIETIARKGYRLRVAASTAAEPDTSLTSAPAEDPAAPIASAPATGHAMATKRHPHWLLGLLLATGLLLGLGYGVWISLHQWTTPLQPLDLSRQATVLTFEPGQKLGPSVSTDGLVLAYLSHEEGMPGFELRWRMSGSIDVNTLLPASPGRRLYPPAMSRDGKSIALIVADHQQAAVWVFDRASGAHREYPLPNHRDFARMLDWHPDARRLALMSAESEAQTDIVPMLLDLQQGQLSVLDSARNLPGNAGLPRFSPDGAALAFVQRDGVNTRLCVSQLETSSSRCGGRLVAPNSLDWRRDSQTVLVLDLGLSPGRLLAFDRHAKATAMADVADITQITVAHGPVEQIVFKHAISRIRLLRMSLAADAPASESWIAPASGRDTQAQWASNGRDVWFVSNRDGREQIWSWQAGQLLRHSEGDWQRILSYTLPDSSGRWWVLATRDDQLVGLYELAGKQTKPQLLLQQEGLYDLSPHQGKLLVIRHVSAGAQTLLTLAGKELRPFDPGIAQPVVRAESCGDDLCFSDADGKLYRQHARGLGTEALPLVMPMLEPWSWRAVGPSLWYAAEQNGSSFLRKMRLDSTGEDAVHAISALPYSSDFDINEDAELLAAVLYEDAGELMVLPMDLANFHWRPLPDSS